MADRWLVDTRDSYDADADGYTDKVQGLLEASPYGSDVDHPRIPEHHEEAIVTRSAEQVSLADGPSSA
jgi:hypothetical protein